MGAIFKVGPRPDDGDNFHADRPKDLLCRREKAALL
jgi:hypothetical protein